MKKLITLTIALFITVGYAFSQTVNNSANIQQTSENNEGEIIQAGNQNQSAIAQGMGKGILFGNNGLKDFDQGTARDNEAFIEQIGTGNLGSLAQGVNSGTAESVGDFQQRIHLSQTGNNNSVQINQGDWGTAINNEATYTQTGNLNKGRIYQGLNGGTAIANDSEILQNGNSNFARIFQGITLAGISGGGIALGNTSLITQEGERNSAVIWHGARGFETTNSNASITQLSSNNDALIEQAGNNQAASITQSN